MAVHIRLRRMGKKKQPFYRIVAADSRRARNGRFLEILGTYNSITKPAEIRLFEERVSYWLDQGAVPSVTVNSLFRQIGFNEKYQKAKRGEETTWETLTATITERRKRTRKIKKAAVAAEESAKAEAAATKAKAAEAEAEAETKTEEPEAEEAKAKAEAAEAAPAEEEGAEDTTEKSE